VKATFRTCMVGVDGAPRSGEAALGFSAMANLRLRANTT
jgi:hypothetical protein